MMVIRHMEAAETRIPPTPPTRVRGRPFPFLYPWPVAQFSSPCTDHPSPTTPVQAKSNGIPICERRGLHAHQLLPHYDALLAHLSSLEAQPVPTFAKPPHLGPPTEALDTLAEAARQCKKTKDADWKARVREGYDRACGTMWRVAQEFDVRGYGLALRQKLVGKWCECGCATDHLGEVCEPTVRAEEVESGVRAGKEREWDGRGAFFDLLLASRFAVGCVGGAEWWV